jgi:uncharacterized protein with PQ loop repeat
MQMPRRHILHKKVSETPRKQPFDYVVYVFMIATPLFELPQAISIYSARSAENVSLLTWGFFFINGIVWLAYVIRKRLRPLIVMYALYMIVEAGIVAGII